MWDGRSDFRVAASVPCSRNIHASITAHTPGCLGVNAFLCWFVKGGYRCGALVQFRWSETWTQITSMPVFFLEAQGKISLFFFPCQSLETAYTPWPTACFTLFELQSRNTLHWTIYKQKLPPVQEAWTFNSEMPADSLRLRLLVIHGSFLLCPYTAEEAIYHGPNHLLQNEQSCLLIDNNWQPNRIFAMCYVMGFNCVWPVISN